MESTESPNALIAPGLQALLHDIVDYAGLFPPADLPLREAIEHYAEYRTNPESWMLGRFVLPARRLEDLTPHQALFKQGEPYVFSALGTGGPTPDAFLEALDADLAAIDEFDEHHAGRTTVDVMEVRLPSSLIGSSQADVDAFLDAVDRKLVTAGIAKLDLFLEVPMRDDSMNFLPTVGAALAEFNSRQPLPARSEAGLKMRLGGDAPSDVPSVEQVARVITASRAAGIRFKATAGLHHPMRHYDTTLETEMHGFLNVFMAAVLAWELNLDVPTVQAILLEDVADNFRFLNDGVGWRDVTVDMSATHDARETFAISFGSCSFQEPIDDLRDLELL